MKFALREIRRRPSRFVTATVILLLVALLLMFLGGLIDGLIGQSTGAVRAQQADLVVFSRDAKESFLRSRIDPVLRSRVDATPGVARSGGLLVLQLGARIPGKGTRDLADTALFGYEIAPDGLPATPPPDGEAYADEILRAKGVRTGMTILLGAYRTPITIIGFTRDTNYLGQGALWASPATWRAVARANNAVSALDEGTFQALVIQTSARPTEVGPAIDRATESATISLTIDAAANAIPGVKEQRGTFNQIIAVTVAIAIVVIALFFALLTIERSAMYGVLKAFGARSSLLFAGVVAQAVVVTIAAAAGGAVLAIGLDLLIPPGSIPFEISASRILSSSLYLLVAAVIGCVFSLRRVLRIDPATAIGGGA